MADTKKSGLSFEWYVISKQAIYLFTVSIITIATLLSGGYCLYKTTRGPLNNSDQSGRKSARFIQIEGKVRVKRANETEFKAATEDVPLEAGDTIQTLSDSVARVQFIDGSSYTIKPDTTLVIKDNSLNADKSTRVQVAVGVGKINLATGEQAAGSSNVVQTENVSASINSQTEASVDADGKGGNTEIRIARGTAKINTPSGQTYEVRSSEKVEVSSNGPIRVEKMAPLPELGSPENQRTIKIPAGQPGQVNFNWAGVPQAKSYRIEVATSAYFGDTVVTMRDQIATTSAAFDNLQPGIYYWRVRANSEKEGAGQYSEPFRFSLASNAEDKAINISFARATPLGGGVYKIEGKSDPGTRVKVGDTAVWVNSDGSFRTLVTLDGGQREVLIEAEDQGGNKGQKRLKL
ncbi:MAG TPA: FecR domain-containing protein [Blastocatellia bacterium]|nr:FecR domain-containing protein [Blastocatellia bacterium]